jgi:hypothetical protein
VSGFTKFEKLSSMNSLIMVLELELIQRLSNLEQLPMNGDNMQEQSSYSRKCAGKWNKWQGGLS